mmetsp:Transcript_43242/g.64099  ORF Transcript_43242/g.64099 Transcript_43242/m.64099 type:complete len:87 (+) Transcript_43242:150-410(+)
MVYAVTMSNRVFLAPQSMMVAGCWQADGTDMTLTQRSFYTGFCESGMTLVFLYLTIDGPPPSETLRGYKESILLHGRGIGDRLTSP